MHLREVVVGILDGGQRGRSVDAGNDLQMAVALIVLCTIRIARPQHKHERLVARFEHWQHNLGSDVSEIFLLHNIGNQCAWLFESPRVGVVAWRVLAGGRDQRQARSC